MNVPVAKSWTRAAFLEWEARQPARFEFDGVRPVAMTGGTAAHAAIQRNLAIAIGGRLRGTACRFFGNDLKIEVAGSFRYPDGLITCSAVPARSTVAPDPVVVFEVLSESSAGTDRIIKLREYQATASIQRYVILEQDLIAATVMARRGEAWTVDTITAGETLGLPEAGIEFALDELYEGIEFD
jgi:Uma2 family endonuclease